MKHEEKLISFHTWIAFSFSSSGETRDRNGTSKETGGSREGQGGQRGCQQERENEADEGTGNKKIQMKEWY